MKIYILEVGCYEDSYIRGVFSTPEKAMAAWHPERGVGINGAPLSPSHTYTWGSWEEDDGVDREFDADWGDAASVREYEVDESCLRGYISLAETDGSTSIPQTGTYLGQGTHQV